MKKPKAKSAMRGPIGFVKTQSKRISRQKINSAVPKNPKEKILKSIRTNIKSSVGKLGSKPKKQVVRKVLESTLPKGLERLEKHMAQSGLSSRREAKELIRTGKVSVNGKIIREPGFGITVGKDVIELKESTRRKEAILFYKPRGIETSKTSPESKDIHDKFPQFAHLAPVGRLDKDSEGLIILSNDGVLAKMITGEHSTIEKEYKVTVREDVMPVVLSKMEKGIIMIEGSPTLPCVTKKLARNEYSITLREGRKHQVRRMANACQMTVTRLVRIRIGNLTIGKMTAGNFKQLPESAINELKQK